MGELIDAVEANLAKEEGGETGEPQETLPEDNTTLQAGVEDIAALEAQQKGSDDGDAVEEGPDEGQEADEDGAAGEAGEADGSEGDRQKAGDAEAPEEEAEGSLDHEDAADGEEAPGAEEPLSEEKIPEDLEVTVKVDGKDEKVPFAELKNSYQVRKYASQQVEAAREMQQNMLGMRKAILQNPLFAIEQLLTGHLGSPEFAHRHLGMMIGKWMEEELAFESMPEEQKQIVREKRQLELEKQQWQDRQRQQPKPDQSQARRDRETEIEEELEKSIKAQGLRDSREMRGAIIREILEARQDGIALTPREATTIVRKRRERRFSEELKQTLSDDELLEKFPEFADRIRKRDRQVQRQKRRQARSPQSSAAAKATSPEAPEPTKPATRRRQSFDNSADWLRYIEEKHGR